MDHQREQAQERIHQVTEWPFRVTGAKASDIVEGSSLAVEALGERVKEPNSGLTAFAYLWRRFGPPWAGCDSHKDLVGYDLTTHDPEVFLILHLSGSCLAYAVGYGISEALDEAIRQPKADWWTRYEEWIKRTNPDEATWEKWSFDSNRIKEAQQEIGPLPAREPKDWREGNALRIRVNEALITALRDLLRPVHVRDVAINLLGRVQDGYSDDCVWHSPYAGYGVPKEAMDEWLKPKP